MTYSIAKATSIRVSPRKLNLVLGLISGLGVQDAVLQLRFSNKGVAPDVLKVLNSAIANAENNLGLDIDRLYVQEAFSGKAITMKRFHARARGRASRIKKFFSNLTIKLAEKV